MLFGAMTLFQRANLPSENDVEEERIEQRTETYKPWIYAPLLLFG